MKFVRPLAARQRYRTLTVLFILATLSAGCASSTLPSKAKSVLREEVMAWADAESSFEVVSAQKASGDSGDIAIPTDLTAGNGQPGACPPAGTSETWCVVVSPAIADHDGNTISHFLVQRQGRYWDVQRLLDTDRSVFDYQGCTNWYVQ
jgi:hypothetical protein